MGKGRSQPLPSIRLKLAHALRVPAHQLEALLAGPDRSGLAATEVPRQLPAAVAGFTGRAAELTALTEILTSPGDGPPGTVAWQIPWAVGSYLDWRGHWHEWVTVQGTAVAAATRLADPGGQAMSLRILASALVRIGDHDQALAHLGQCLALYQRLGDRFGEAQVLKYLGVVAERQGRYADALEHSEQSLRMFQAIGRRSDEAQMFNNVGWTHARLGDYQKARQFCYRAITLHAELGRRNQEAIAWDSLGYIEHHQGDLAEAAACYQRSLSLAREYGDRFAQSEILTHLGDTSDVAGDQVHAREAWQQALDILDDLNHPKAIQVRAKLTSTQDQAAPTPPENGRPAR